MAKERQKKQSAKFFSGKMQFFAYFVVFIDWIPLFPLVFAICFFLDSVLFGRIICLR